MNNNFEENIPSDVADVQLPVCRETYSTLKPNFSLDCNTNDSHDSGWTPLLRACRYGQTEIIIQLLLDGADLTARDSFGWNAVPLAVASGNIGTLEKILEAFKWTKKDLAPALCLAALNGDCKIAEILLSYRACPNVPVEDSEITPLMLASGEGHIEMVSLLLEYSADPDMTNALHQTALDAAVIRNKIALQTILGPVTHLRSKISSHIPLPTSPPNRALPSPNYSHPDVQFLGASPFMVQSRFMNHCHSHNPGLGSSPVLHFIQSPSHICETLRLPLGGFVANSPALKNKGYMSPLPASYPSLASPFNFRGRIPQTNGATLTPCHSRCPARSCQDVKGNFKDTPSKVDVGHNQSSIAKGNKRLRKWWCQMKKRCIGEQLDKNEELLNEDKFLDAAMEKRLANFLRSIKMSEYYSLFTGQEVDFETFLTLTEEDLEEIGVKNPAHRSKIVQKIEKFSRNATLF